MELKQIKELMASMGRTGLKRLSIKKEGFELQLEREDGFRAADSLDLLEEISSSSDATRRANVALSRAKETEASLSGSKPAVENTGSGLYVTSPMVGTFYASPSPEDPPFVKVGDRVEKNTVVCIIEAMKVMNEVKSGISGVVAEVLIESSHPVEFGTKLFRIVEKA